MNWKITRPILQSLRNWNIHWQMGLIPVSGPRNFFSPKGGATAHQEAEKMFWNDSNYRTSIQCVPYFVSTGPLRSQMIILEDRCADCFCSEILPLSRSSPVFLKLNYRTSIQCVPYFVSTGPLRWSFLKIDVLTAFAAKFYRYLDRRLYSWSSIIGLQSSVYLILYQPDRLDLKWSFLKIDAQRNFTAILIVARILEAQ
jgi:hypothetical protein